MAKYSTAQLWTAVVLIAAAVVLMAIFCWPGYNPGSWTVFFAHFALTFGLIGAGIGMLCNYHVKTGAIVGAGLGLIAGIGYAFFYFASLKG